VLPCDFCTFDTSTTIEEGTRAYQNTLSRQITIKGQGILDLVPFSFGGSYDFKQVQQQSSAYRNVFSDTNVECCTYKIRLSPFLPPSPSAEFMAALQAAPLEYDSNFYLKLINYFGPLVASSMTTGAIFGVRSTFLSSGYSQMESTTVDMSAYAADHMWIFSAAVSAMSQQQIQMASTYQRFVNKTSVYSYGGKLPANGSVSAWLNTVTSNSLPLTSDFMPLSDVMDPLYITDFNVSALKIIQNNTQYCILNEYCPWLVSQGVVSQCTGLGPDAPLPPSSIFGGFYQADDAGKDNVLNSFTGRLACPQGYSFFVIGRIQAPESSYGATQYLCLLDGVQSDGQLNYGGGYQVAAESHNDFGSRVNPLTGNLSCPLGYSSVLSAFCLTRSRIGIDISQYSCLNTSHVPTYETIGGFYMVDDSGLSIALNVFTSAASCPVNYCAAPTGRVISTKGMGGTPYVCIACNLLNTSP